MTEPSRSDAYGNPDFLNNDNKNDDEKQQALNAYLNRLQISNSIKDQGESSSDDADEDFELSDAQVPVIATHIPTIIDHESLRIAAKKGLLANYITSACCSVKAAS
jgi:hypothetical protein